MRFIEDTQRFLEHILERRPARMHRVRAGAPNADAPDLTGSVTAANVGCSHEG